MSHRDDVRRILNSAPAAAMEVKAKLLMLEGKILRLQFEVPLDHFDLTPAQAIEFGKLLIDHGARMVP